MAGNQTVDDTSRHTRTNSNYMKPTALSTQRAIMTKQIPEAQSNLTKNKMKGSKSRLDQIGQ